MLNIGPQELLIILVIALIVVGPQRLPELGRSIGRGLRELRKAQDEVKRTIQVNLDDEPPNGSSAQGASARAAAGPSGGQASEPGASIGTTTGETIPPVLADSAPTASEPLPANEIKEISRSLGRSLAELRRAKEEVQRSFRVDLAGSSVPKPSRDAPGAPTKPSEPDRPQRGPSEPSTAPADAGGPSATPASTPAASTPEPSPDGRSAAPDRTTD